MSSLTTFSSEETFSMKILNEKCLSESFATFDCESWEPLLDSRCLLFIMNEIQTEKIIKNDETLQYKDRLLNAPKKSDKIRCLF